MFKNREMRALLREYGYVARQGKGSHEIWSHPQLPGRGLTLCGKDGEDTSKYQVARLKKQARKLGGAA